MRKNLKNITFVIHPTPYQDYDILAIGDLKLLFKLAKSQEGTHLLKKSKFGGIPILVCDTCDTLRDAMGCVKEYKKLSMGIRRI